MSTPVTEAELYTATLGDPDHVDRTERSAAYHWFLPNREPTADSNFRLTAKLYVRYWKGRGYLADLETGSIEKGPYFVAESLSLCGPKHGPSVKLHSSPAGRYSRTTFQKVFNAALDEVRQRGEQAANEVTAESILDEVLGS